MSKEPTKFIMKISVNLRHICSSEFSRVLVQAIVNFAFSFELILLFDFRILYALCAMRLALCAMPDQGADSTDTTSGTSSFKIFSIPFLRVI